MTLRLVGVVLLFCAVASAQNVLRHPLNKASAPSPEKQSTDESDDSNEARVQTSKVVLPPAPLVIRKHADAIVVPGVATAGPEGYKPKFTERGVVARSTGREGAKTGQSTPAGENVTTGQNIAKRQSTDVDPWASIQISSGFGYRRDPFTGRLRFHSGVDLKARLGDPVAASEDGVIRFVGWYHGYGNLIMIDHGDGITTRYGHLSSFAAEPGQVVKRGDIIGYAGSTGRATSPHLHYEVRVSGKAVNPADPILLEIPDPV
ncbi:MAG: M23 family metallopeptidase, partial [Blastocatellia bacterium]